MGVEHEKNGLRDINTGLSVSTALHPGTPSGKTGRLEKEGAGPEGVSCVMGLWIFRKV